MGVSEILGSIVPRKNHIVLQVFPQHVIKARFCDYTNLSAFYPVQLIVRVNDRLL